MVPELGHVNNVLLNTFVILGVSGDLDYTGEAVRIHLKSLYCSVFQENAVMPFTLKLQKCLWTTILQMASFSVGR